MKNKYIKYTEDHKCSKCSTKTKVGFRSKGVCTDCYQREIKKKPKYKSYGKKYYKKYNSTHKQKVKNAEKMAEYWNRRAKKLKKLKVGN